MSTLNDVSNAVRETTASLKFLNDTVDRLPEDAIQKAPTMALLEAVVASRELSVELARVSALFRRFARER